MTAAHSHSLISDVIVRHKVLQDYLSCWQAMKKFTDERQPDTLDEIWFVQHPAVFTQGQNGKPEHVLQPSAIPLVQTDRGGQITYHAPGQLMVYTLIDVKRKKWNIRELVTRLEQSVIAYLAQLNIEANSKCKAPGVYVENKKICSIGLRIRRGCAYHGLALNIDMDLTPFTWINPCGYQDLQMTQLKNLTKTITLASVSRHFVEYLLQNLGYNNHLISPE